MDSNPGVNTYVIFNPASGKGAGARRMPEYLSLLREHVGRFQHGITERAGEEAELADQALTAGYGRIVAVGGDGTWSRVADRIVASGRKDVVFGVLPAGTGNDFVKGLGGGFDVPQVAVRALTDGKVVEIDMGRVDVTRPPAEGRTSGGIDGDPSGQVAPRYFTLLVGFGIDTEIIRSVQRTRFLRGPIVYHAAAVRNIFGYRAPPMAFTDGDEIDAEGDFVLLAVCNGPIVGGGFHIAPGASLTDGILDVRAMRDAGTVARARTLMAVERGRGDESELVESWQTTSLQVRFESPQPWQIDGELQDKRIIGADIRVIPRALRVLVPGR